MADTLLTFYELDASNIVSNTVFRYTNESQSIVFAGQLYEPIAIESSGFDKDADGTLPQPQINIGDPSGNLCRIVRALSYLSNAKITRRRIRHQEIDSPANEYPKDIFYVSHVNLSPGVSIVLSLRSPLELGYKKFPGRTLAALLNE